MISVLPVVALGFWGMTQTDDRVADARRIAEPTVREKFARVGLDYPPVRTYLRAFKQEKELEVWAAPATGPFRLVDTYRIAGMSGGLGPKRREGDGQVPEGFYAIDTFNPRSRFLLSMRVNYPNESDRIRGKAPLGGDIYIHGDVRSIGCLAMTDSVIQELYLIELDARIKRRPIHIFPARLTDRTYKRLAEQAPGLASFWLELKKGYDGFEQMRRLPTVRVLRDGRYAIR